MKDLKTFLVALVALVLLVGCNSSSITPSEKEFVGAVSSSIQLTSPAEGSEECLLRPIQLNFVKMPPDERRAKFVDPEWRKELTSEGYYPRPVNLAWKNANEASKYTVTLSTTADFAEGTVREYTAKGNNLKVDNLMIATKYYWKVSDGKEESAVGSFTTADIAPRLIRAPKVRNVRDLGGRIGLDGRRVKQNMIYRSGGINENSKLIYYTLDELLEIDENVRQFKAVVDRTTNYVEDANRELRPALVSNEWTVFRPDKKTFSDADVAEVIAIKAIPAEIFGGEGVKMPGDAKNNTITFEPAYEAMPVVFMQYVDAPADGLVPFQCGADWFWRLAVNNEVIYDFWTGNDVDPVKESHILAMPVKKGRNLVTVVLGSGNKRCVWHYAPLAKDMSREEIAEKVKTIMKNKLDGKCKVVKKDADGNMMYIAGKPLANDEGRKIFVKDLGIKIEIDLRSEEEVLGIVESHMGPEVTWLDFPFHGYSGLREEISHKALNGIFKILVDEKNYPLDFHCIAGADRTGTVACILNGLLGVSENELLLDWEVTGYVTPNVAFSHEKLFDSMLRVFKKFEGKTLNERIENYMLSIGITHDDIQRFRDIMLEP